MRHTHFKVWRSATAMLLVFTMLFGLCGTAFAATPNWGEDDTIVYVSIGDSMTNGYGIDGYDGSSGIVNYGMQTYSNKFAAYLAGYTGPIEDDQVIFTGTNGTVDHRQLAMSGMRAEDVHWALELDYKNEALIDLLWTYQYDGNSWQNVREKWYGEFGFKSGDFRTWCDLVDADYRYAEGAARILRTYKNSPYFTSSYADKVDVDAVIAGLNADKEFPSDSKRNVMGKYYLPITTEFYQESVKDADIISLALGNTNFGTYMMSAMMDVVMDDSKLNSFVEKYDIEDVFALADLEPNVETAVRNLVSECDALIRNLFGGLAGGSEEKAAALNYIITYCVASYIVNYIGAVDAILTLNEKDHLDLIQVALINAYDEEAEGVTGTTLGDVVHILYTPINTFIAALPTVMQATGDPMYEKATFYYAEADRVASMVTVYGDDFFFYDDNDDGVKNANEAYVTPYPGWGFDASEMKANLNSIVRHRFIEEGGGIVKGQIFGLLADVVEDHYGLELKRNLTVQQIADYESKSDTEKALYASEKPDEAISCAFYLAFENATIKAGPGIVTLDSLTATSDLLGAFGDVMGVFAANIGAAGAPYASVAADVIASIANAKMGEMGLSANFSKDHILGIYAGELSAENAAKLVNDNPANAAVIDALAKAVVVERVWKAGYKALNSSATDEEIDAAWQVGKNAALADAATYLTQPVEPGVSAWEKYGNDAIGGVKAVVVSSLQSAADNVSTLCLMLALPKTLSDAMVGSEDGTVPSNEIVSGLLCMNARTIIGTGIGCHPSTAGHYEEFEAIKLAYDADYTSQKQTFVNVVEALNFAYDFIMENYEEIYAKAWEIADKYGYIAEANYYLDEAANVIGGLNVDANITTELKAELAALKSDVLSDITALKAIVNSPVHAGAASNFWVLMNELSSDLTSLQNVAKQAGIDGYDQLLVLHAQIMKQLDTAYKEACKQICTQLGKAYDMIVAEIKRVGGQMIEEYLGQNPDELIESIKIYGQQAEAFLKYWGRYAELLLGPTWNEYGEDITAFVEENLAKLLETLKAEAEELGSDAVEALVAYIEELQIVENFTAIANELKNGSIPLAQKTLDELEGIVRDLDGKLTTNATAVVTALEELLKSEDAIAAEKIINDAINEIKATEANRIAALQAIYDDILDAKVTVEEAASSVKNVYDAATALKDFLANPSQFSFSDTVAAANTLFSELSAAVDTVKTAAIELQKLTKDINIAATKIYNEALAAKDNVEIAIGKIEGVLVDAAPEAKTLLENAYNAAESYVTTTLKKVETDIGTLLALCESELTTAVTNVIEAVETALFDATHGEYMLKKDSYYVALGNADYAAGLAAALGLENQYVKLALTDDYLSEVAKADLVTVQFDNGEFIQFMAKQAMGLAAGVVTDNVTLMELLDHQMYGPVLKDIIDDYNIDLTAEAEELNWDLYLDARAQGVLFETLANVKSIMLEEGIPETYVFDIGAIANGILNEGLSKPVFTVDILLEIPVADLAVKALENVLYGYVRFANEYVNVLNAIHAAAPEAEVIVTGMVNPLEGVVLTFGDVVVDLDAYAEYAQYAVEALNLHYFGYALVTPKTTYVENPDVQSILDALILSYETLLGDVDLDGDVDMADAVAAMRHAVKAEIITDPLALENGDVTGDGVVDMSDAVKIMRYVVKAISSLK